MDVFSPATAVVNNTLQALPSSLTPTLTPGTGQESNTHESIVEDMRHSLAVEISESRSQLAIASESSTPATKIPSKKERYIRSGTGKVATDNQEKKELYGG